MLVPTFGRCVFPLECRDAVAAGEGRSCCSCCCTLVMSLCRRCHPLCHPCVLPAHSLPLPLSPLAAAVHHQPQRIQPQDSQDSPEERGMLMDPAARQAAACGTIQHRAPAS